MNYVADEKAFNVTFSAGEPTDGAHIRARLCFNANGNLIRRHNCWTVSTDVTVG